VIEVTDDVKDGVIVAEVIAEVTAEDVVVVGVILVGLTVHVRYDVDITRAADELSEHETATSSWCSQL